MNESHDIRRLEGDPHNVYYRLGDDGLTVDEPRIKSTGGAWIIPDGEEFRCSCGASFETKDLAARHLAKVQSDDYIRERVYRAMWDLCRDVRHIKFQMDMQRGGHSMGPKEVAGEEGIEWSTENAELLARVLLDYSLDALRHAKYPGEEYPDDTIRGHPCEDLLFAIVPQRWVAR